jgi:type I restriction enzyme M protein
MYLTGVIKSIQDIMRQDAGIDGDAQRISQLVWMIFLKVFDSKEQEWEIINIKNKNVIPKEFQWRNWAKNDEGLTGDELLAFVNDKLFKFFKSWELNEFDDKKKFLVKEMFVDSFNYMKSGTLLRQVVNKLNEIDFSSQSDRHLFNDIYESILVDLQSAGNSGEFYTPRPITKFMVDMLDPNIDEKVLDFACGTGGFLVSAVENMKKKIKKVSDIETIQKNIVGIEKKPLPHLLSTTNLILHDIDLPNIKRDNSLSKNVKDINNSDRVDIIIANPPFGGREEPSTLANFPNSLRSDETSDLFMVLLVYLLKENGRAGIVLPDGFFSSDTAVKVNIKELLLSKLNLHTVIKLPIGVFSPYAKNVNTNILFFSANKPTSEVWFFEHPLPEGYIGYSKNKPIQYNEFELEKKWWNNRELNKMAWKVSIDDIKKNNYNLDFRNPSKEAVKDNKDMKTSILEIDEKIKLLIDTFDQLKKEVKDNE